MKKLKRKQKWTKLLLENEDMKLNVLVPKWFAMNILIDYLGLAWGNRRYKTKFYRKFSKLDY